MLIFATLRIEHGYTLLGASGLCVVIFGVSQTDWRRYIRNVALLSWLLLMTFLIRVWGNLSSSVVTIAGQTVINSHADLLVRGLMEGAFAVGQLGLAVGWVTLLGAATSPLELLAGLERVARPLCRIPGVPIRQTLMTAMLSMRFMPIILEEAHTLLSALFARGVDFHDGALRDRFRQMTFLLVPLLTNILRRAEHITQAMENRAFHINSTRTSLYTTEMRRRDYALLSVGTLVTVGIFLYE